MYTYACMFTFMRVAVVRTYVCIVYVIYKYIYKFTCISKIIYACLNACMHVYMRAYVGPL